MKKVLRDLLAPSGKWSFGRMMLAFWFGIMCWFAVSNGKAFGKVLERMFDTENAAQGATAVPYLDGFTYYLTGVFLILCGYVFAGKTNLNVTKSSIQTGDQPPANGSAQ